MESDSQKTNNGEINLGELYKFINSPNFIILVMSIFCLLLLLNLYGLTNSYNQLIDLYSQNCVLQSAALVGGIFG